MLAHLMTSVDRTYVDHTHVTYGFAVAAIGAVLLVLGLVRKVLVLVGLAVVVVVAGVVFGVISLHGTHCSPDSTKKVCVTLR